MSYYASVTPEISYDPEQIAVVFNPASTNQARIGREIASLPNGIVEIETHQDYRYTRDALYSVLEPGFVVLGLGGDGTANQLGNIMMDPETEELGLHNVPFVPRPCGKGNDIARSYNGRRRVTDVLKLGRPARMHPLEIRVAARSEPEAVRYALGYFSVGSAAAGARALEDAKTHDRLMQYGPQQVRDVAAVLGAVAHYPEFLFKIGKADVGFASDLTFVRGKYMAKYGRLHADARVPAYERVITPYAGYTDSLRTMGRLATGRLHGDILSAATSAQVKTIVGNPLPVQYDGETRTLGGRRAEVASGSTVIVGLAERSFTTLLI